MKSYLNQYMQILCNQLKGGEILPFFKLIKLNKMKNKKPLTAKKLLKFLLDLEKSGIDLSSVDILYRYDRDSDETNVYEVEEDLYDENDNSTLTSIMLLTNGEEL